MAMPPGFRFHPTDEELVAYYLKKKVAGRNIEFNIIGVIDLYKQEPWDLPDKSLLKGSDAEWYFFSPRDKKYPNGLRTNRATEAGYWKATGKDRNVKKKEKVVGMKKTLVFYMGRAPHGERTDWVMHEYRLDEEECEKIHASQDLFVLCRVFKKNGVGPRSGEDRGPQTYVDDDLDQEPSGTFADALRKALEPREDPGPQSVDDDPDQELSGTFADTAKTVLEHESIPKPERQAAPVETPNVAPVDSNPIPTPILSVSDYRPGYEGIDRVDVPTLEGYGLDDKFVESEEDEQFWETFLNAPEFGLPPAPLDGSLQQLPGSEGSELFGAWQGDRDTNGPCGMMWNRDLGGTTTPVQQEDELIGADGYADALQIQLLESHDRLPPLEEERESSGSPNGSEHRANVPDFSENVNQQSRGRGPARARSRAARQQPTFEEVQQRARSSNDGLYGDEAMSPRRMFNMLLRGHEIASQAREDTTSLNATWPASVGSAANNFDNNQAASSSSASAAVVDNSGVCSDEEDLFSFHDPLYDFAIDDELMNAASYEDDNYVRSPLAHELTGNQGSSSQPAKPSESVDGESAPSSSAPEGSSGKSKPVSKPLAGLMKLLGSMPALPASAAEYPSDRKTVQSNEEVASTFSCIHVSAVTVTCTSSGDGAQKVQAAVTDCRLHGDAQGMYQQVVSGSWRTIPEGQKSICAKCDSVATGGLQRRVTRGSNSGFVFVFVLGAVSALCWFLLIRCMLRLVRHVVTSVF